MSQRGGEEALSFVSAGLSTAALSLARGFASGGTLWCWAPGSTSHAQHVAVEFVHPVIVGTRALPAVAVADSAVTTMRTMARSGDALLVLSVAGGGDAAVADILRRAQAWGLTTMWMGVGVRPATSDADHLLWLSEDVLARHDGRLVLGYHLLWELTHVCFEHPGLLRHEPAGDGVCITCSDEGRLAEVVEVRGPDEATARTACGIETVSTMMVGEVEPGDLLLVHAGTAITVVEP